jgi:phthiocerol/phenolphthiocerol synthesis type-I polyketide synthase C
VGQGRAAVKPVHQLRDDIAVIGWACRLPGANSISELWSLLLEGRCAVTSVPPDRFSLERFSYPRRQERGKSYSWAAGVLDDIWGFDPGVFGISPREAEQMDPQQRILLQLTWEALEDAGIRPTSIAGSDVGVFVGASQTDYGHAFFADHAIADAHFATGTALSVLANRISYVYDLRGPSICVDTACSSSLVALYQAVEAMRAGRIDTAIVAGINLIASPASFIAFSQASMLSPTGLCQAFSAKADGFVRGEGGAVLVLRKAAHSLSATNPIHGLVIAIDVNSDGRTNGISLPSLDAQEALLQRVFSRSGIDPERLAFMEAHGTGTSVGDPIEAAALGRAIGRNRNSPLPIGSIKTNIGHLEPASGLAGLLKALLALNHGILPRSLHFDEPNPNIDFERLNLTVCNESLLLPDAAERYAGVNSFGFGGTNAHAIVAPGRNVPVPNVDAGSAGAGFFFLSAESKPALLELAEDYAGRAASASDQEIETLASAVVYRREHLRHRIAVTSSRSETVATALHAYAAGSDELCLRTATAIGDDMPVAFVYSGNGSQWIGMGVSAYQKNAQFRAHFELVDSHFKQLAGWSLREALFSDSLKERLSLTGVAQPLIFAIQSATTAALNARGLVPAVVFGHSVGEVAAAQAAGILDLRAAVNVIYFRSTHQELTRGCGRMAAIIAPADKVEALAKTIGNIEIAAINSPRAVTVAASREALGNFKRLLDSLGVLFVPLDLDYPFHTAMMEPVELPLLADLKNISPRDAAIPFVSTVTGALLPGSRLDGRYWWRNVREPVRFLEAVRAAAKLGARYFVEIGPRATLLKHITDSFEGDITRFAAMSVLDRDQGKVDPFDVATAQGLVTGAQIDLRRVFGVDPGPGISLPTYPWQQQKFRFVSTPEAIGVESERHPFAGARYTPDDLEWRSHIDTVLFPELNDHRVGEQTIFPGTGFLEIAQSVGRQWLRTESAVISNFEILKPLALSGGETREVMTRVSPGSNTIEIFSRPRLSHAAWLQHCRGKILHPSAMDTGRLARPPQTGRIVSGAQLYRVADACGLHYGPAFRLARKTTVHNSRLITIELAPQTKTTSFVLDPMRLDGCSHGMIAMFPEMRAEERGVAYIPVRVDEYTLFQPNVVPAYSVIEVLDKSERSFFANLHVFSSDDTLIAVLRGIRCQAVVVKRVRPIESVAVVELPALIDGSIVGKTGVATSARDFLAAARSLHFVSEAVSSEDDEGSLLIEGWAMAAAYEIASGLADDGRVDVDSLLANGRLPEELRSWFVNVVTQVEAAGLAALEHAGIWRLMSDPSLPTSASVVKALSIERPTRAAELLLAGAITGYAEQIKSTGMISPKLSFVLLPGVLDFHDSANVASAQWSDMLFELLRSAKGLWPRTCALRVLLIGFEPIGHRLAAENDVLLTIFESDRRRYERAQLSLSKYSDVTLLDAEQASKLGTYDLIISVEGLHRLKSLRLEDLTGVLAPRGLLAAIEPCPSLFKDLVFGTEPNWFDAEVSDCPVGPLQSGEQWALALERATFSCAESSPIRCASGFASLVVAKAGEVSKPSEVVDSTLQPVAQKTILFIDLSNDVEFSRRLVDIVAARVIVKCSLDDMSDYAAISPDMVLLANPSSDTFDPVAALAQRCLNIKACAEAMLENPTPLWVIFSGALEATSSEIRPVETGAWAFSRTLANEFRKLDVRRIDVALGTDPADAADQILRIILSGTPETELLVDDTTIRAVRVQELARAVESRPGPVASAAVLKRRTGPGARVFWQPIKRVKPRATEVEIAVEATGLNFRDLMWTLGLLPDDMLEDGFTGPTLGLECAGRVVRVGRSVDNFQPGDRVLALAASSFATYVTVAAAQVAKMPTGMSYAGGASIPVAFLTAYYSLVTLARLRRSETVLIHGGAGGVGMAAIQIAMARGAKVIATAGSSAKRHLLKAFGVPHVLDSRSTSFVDDIREITGFGVDVVLNSLAGEAMERSIACLRPFGRFIELGKRDYVSNTHVGLRPFRKNLSYFGVDVDQLVGGKKAIGERIFAQLIQQFEKGVLSPLPHTVFAASSASEAFDMMQHSTHIGKIVVLPPKAGTLRAVRAPLSIQANGTHVISGAFGGFGLEAARWLVDRGARHLVLLGRQGPTSIAAKGLLQELADRNVAVLAEPCDVADIRAVEKLFEKVLTTMPRVVGVMHAAMVLDDAIIPNLDFERFHTVLSPKVRGAENLNVVTRGLELDYFVLFSSFTTMMGNPGQGNYVAANAYMEGLARRRRKEGLPALAIGWGPIIDVGVVAHSEKLQGNLRKLKGMTGLRAREALDLMAQAMEQPTGTIATAVMTISPSDGAFASDKLPVLRSPTYRILTRGDHRQGEGGTNQINLPALLQSESIDVVHRKVSDAIVSQLARVLHSREDDISRVRPLAEIGLDSLMALELGMNLEQIFGTSVTFAASAGALTVSAVADEIIAQTGVEQSHDEVALSSLVRQHVDRAEAGQLDVLKDMIKADVHKSKRLLS